MGNTSFCELSRLARLYGIQTAYYGAGHRRRTATVEGLMAALRTLDAGVASLSDVPDALRAKRQAFWRRMLEPVTVAWGAARPELRICLPSASGQPLACRLELESGESRNYRFIPGDLPVIESVEVEGVEYSARRLMLPEGLPSGYHRLTLEAGGASYETLIISAPVKAWLPENEERRWGVFLPLYALRDKNGWGSGDYTALESLADWVASQGGSAVATLPLLPGFLDEPFLPSPYSPVSRLLCSEFYIDVAKVPELSRCPAAQAILESPSFTAEIENKRRLPLVDYRRQMALKRRVLEELYRCLPQSPERLTDFRGFIEANPIVGDYARFRAVMEKRREAWPSWPVRLRDGTLREGDYDDAAVGYYMYAQWLAHGQVRAAAQKSRDRGVMLYFDLPLGVHPDGFDVWREREAFAVGSSVGAPPGNVFSAWQNWQFPPLHPERLREQGYRYFIACLRHHLRQAGMLRLDHVMGLHRLYWIPRGSDPSQGVFVRYRAGEFYAILALESHRHRSIIVGEDLGIVPSGVRPAMSRHGLQRLYVVNYAVNTSSREALAGVPRNAVASLNTHDMFPFAAFWTGQDVRENHRLGVLGEGGVPEAMRRRRSVKEAMAAFLRNRKLLVEGSAATRAVLEACLAFLSTSPARLVLLNLEDLWGETHPQNVPSTVDEYPNWRRKARYAFEEFCEMPKVVAILKKVRRWRSGK